MGWDSESEHSSDDEEQSGTNSTSYLLVTIDCDEIMFQKQGDADESTFKIVLRTCYEILELQLMRGVSDDIDGMALCDFKDNLPENVKKFRDLCEMSDTDLENKYKRSGILQFSNFLLNCKRKLTECGQENTKYIAYIGNNDNPIGDDEDERRLCVNHAKTFKDFNIYLELLTFDSSFDSANFFQEILDAANCKFNYQYYLDTIGLKEKLLSLLIFRGTRALFYPFNNRKNFFEVIEKRYIKHQKFTNNVSVTKDTNAEVKRITRGGEPKDTFNLKYSKLCDPLSFSSAEREKMVYDGISTGFTLLGTSETNLIDYCVDKGRYLICARKYKGDGPTKLVQLTPKVVNGIRSFLVMGMPYCNDIHYQDVHNPLYQARPTDNKAISEAAENLVDALTFTYHPLKIPDTVNCRKWEYVRATLLDEKARPVIDVRDMNVIQKNVGDVVKEFQDLTLITGIKRKATSKAKASKKK
ncbi:hypothetical protein QE152_g8545 [Popillia japonica]|uniref:Ku70/Ku80 N-terminal alpha/beta domain-containing protein n=1 Tax=Popillia japonica TaxID=7064 RepID=A0AAW1MBQ6_POPJA